MEINALIKKFDKTQRDVLAAQSVLRVSFESHENTCRQVLDHKEASKGFKKQARSFLESR